jgi:hypothetical protein
MYQNAACSFNFKDNDLVSTFKEHLNSFCELAKNWGFQLLPYSERTWKKFGTLSPLVQKNIAEKFITYHQLCESAAAEGIALSDDRALVWHALLALQFRPPSNLMNHIELGDVVEIYNSDQIQVFRNLRFFEFSGYTIGDIFVNTWQDLYIRSESDITATTKHIVQAYETRELVLLETQNQLPQKLEETFSNEGHVFGLKFKVFAPVFNSKEVCGFLCTSEVELVSKKRVFAEESFSVHEENVSAKTHLQLL